MKPLTGQQYAGLVDSVGECLRSAYSVPTVRLLDSDRSGLRLAIDISWDEAEKILARLDEVPAFPDEPTG